MWQEITNQFPLYRWSLEMVKLFHPTNCWACNYSSMWELKLNHVSKRGPRKPKAFYEVLLKNYVSLKPVWSMVYAECPRKWLDQSCQTLGNLQVVSMYQTITHPAVTHGKCNDMCHFMDFISNFTAKTSLNFATLFLMLILFPRQLALHLRLSQKL